MNGSRLFASIWTKQTKGHTKQKPLVAGALPSKPERSSECLNKMRLYNPLNQKMNTLARLIQICFPKTLIVNKLIRNQ